MNARLDTGDWISGFLPKSRGNRFLYAMEVICVMHAGQYFADARFASKKPKPSLDWKERCGDNIYEQLRDGTWIQHENEFHNTLKQKCQDTKNPKVFVASQFWYLGENHRTVPPRFQPRIPDRQGIRCNHDPLLVSQFTQWVKQSFPLGIQGDPNDARRDVPRYVQVTRGSDS